MFDVEAICLWYFALAARVKTIPEQELIAIFQCLFKNLTYIGSHHLSHGQ